MKKENNTAKYMVYFMAFIMVGSVFGVMLYGFSDSAGSLRYGNFAFENVNGAWVTTIDGKRATFDFSPENVESINLSREAGNILSNAAEIDFTSDINDSFAEQIALAQFSMQRTLLDQKIFFRDGFIEDNEYDKPVITCDDATSALPVIYFRKGNSTRLLYDNGCIIAEAQAYYDVARIKDRLLYAVLGVIE